MEATELTTGTIIEIYAFVTVVIGFLALLIWSAVKEQKEKADRKMKAFKEAEEAAKLPEKVEQYLQHIYFEESN